MAIGLSIDFVKPHINFINGAEAEDLKNCDELASSETPNPGVNCRYLSKPFCKDVKDPKHRENCADLVDLPLCSDIVTSSSVLPQPGRNCVELCSDPAYDSTVDNPVPIRGVDHAVFNKDCIRFCDDPEPGVIADEKVNVNCVSRKCHQTSGPDLESGKCNMLKCNLLTPDELNKSKFDDDSKKYCDGEDLKCYKFDQKQLPYVRIREKNTICNIHECTPSSPDCGPDDVLNITNQGSNYTNDYVRYVNANFPIDNTMLCRPSICKPVVKVQYRCTNEANVITGEDENDIKRNENCDEEGDGSLCNSSYCYKTIDCNIESNKEFYECATNGTVSDESETYIDPFDSWFYRPKPLEKAINPNTGLLRSPMDDRLCYTKSQMKDSSPDGQGYGYKVNLLGWFHNYSMLDSRSPGLCSAARHGNRGLGYTYLCGTDGNLYEKPSDHVGYFKGHARTVFSHNSGKHIITVCLRFLNTLSLTAAHEACGKRECGITAGFDAVWGQTCGDDVCRDFEVNDILSDKCMMTEEYANNVYSSECAKDIDRFLRIRVVKYDNRVCAFLDSKLQLSYKTDQKMFFDGTETLSDGKTCVNDPEGNGLDGGCNGYNSRSDRGLAHVWRTILKIPYIQNNRPESASSAGKPLRGYIDKKGKFYPEQECAKITLRIPPPDAYNLANASNSANLFAPPLYIRSAVKIKGGSDSIAPEGQLLGKTDFHYPEIKVQFGTTVKRMSLSINEVDGDAITNSDRNSPSNIVLKMAIGSKEYQADVFVKKEYRDFAEDEPVFCLYRKIKDSNGNYMKPLRIACIDRSAPEIDNIDDRFIDKTLPVRKVLVYPDLENKYDDLKLILRYLASFGEDKKENTKEGRCAGDDVCSNELVFKDVDYKNSTCLSDLEGYKVCAKREECSKIYIECVNNEAALHNAMNKNENLSTFQSIRNYCNKTLIPLCNGKRGIYTNSDLNVYDMIIDPDKYDGDKNAYGWFNEICIVSGFNGKLKNVVTLIPKNTLNLGKCVISPLSPYLNDNDSKTNCDNGGLAPNCLCLEAPDENFTTTAGQIVRKQTAREAGLCIDMPIPQLCPAIDYNLNPNITDINDSEYINQSLGKTSYNNNGGVHLSHQARTAGKVTGNAEFPAVLIGMNDVKGECKAFFAYDKTSTGITLYPQMSCKNVNGKAQWDYEIKNQCTRFSCPIVTTLGPDDEGVYQDDYEDSGEVDVEDKGRSHGYALWPRFTKSEDSDFAQNIVASTCIDGFKPSGSQADKTGVVITGYTGGNKPVRACNQIGIWEPVFSSTVNQCVRIYCKAFNPEPPPSQASDWSQSQWSAFWNQWFDYGGATFSQTPASRSKARIQKESIQKGTCNNSLGFYQSSPNIPPTRECDYLGNWLPVKNTCVSSCNEIATDIEGGSLNNGYAKWEKATGSSTGAPVEGTFKSCVDKYYPNPYPPAYDIYGNLLPNANVIDSSRNAENPKRLCKTGVTSTGAKVSVWGDTINGCINKCPSATDDARIGVGRTSHNATSGNLILDWPSGNFNEYTYLTNWESEQSLFNASYFQKDRNGNKYYLVRRFCNSNGRWSDPEPMCSVNNGQIEKAKYNITTVSLAGYKNSLVAGSASIAQGSCIPSNWKSNNNQGALPQRSCIFKDANKNIDETYLELVNNTKDCEAIKCKPIPANTYSSSRASIPAVTAYSPTGSQIKGTCKATYKLVGVNPSIYCRSDGNWSSSITDENNCKASCTIPDHAERRLNSKGCDNGDGFGFYTFTLQHGQFAYFVAHSDCHEDSCRNWAYAVTCNNGTSSVIEEEWGGWPGDATQICSRRRYNPSTNAFEGSYISSDSKGTHVEYPNGQNFINKNGDSELINSWRKG